jgi:hypothetical protein
MARDRSGGPYHEEERAQMVERWELGEIIAQTGLAFTGIKRAQ